MTAGATGTRTGPGRRELGLAALSGVLLGAAFQPWPLGWLAWFALVPLLVALERGVRQGWTGGGRFLLGWSFGLVFYAIGAYWIALLSDVAITVPLLKYPAWLAAAAYLALFAGLATWLAGTLARRTGGALAWIVPPVFVAVEELRASGELGFPWFQPGYTQHAIGPILQLASLGSVTLVTLWLIALNVLVWRAFAGSARLRAGLGAALALLLPWMWGLRVLDAAPRGSGPAVALVQANIPGEMKWSGKHQREILDRFLALSDSAASVRPKPVLTIWPETATGTYLRHQIDQAYAVVSLAARTDVPILTGLADYRMEPSGRVRYFNAAALFRAEGAGDPIYAKRHLVPFGERMPFQWILPSMGAIDLGQAEWTPGTEAVQFPSAAGPFAVLICFEAIFPDQPRAAVRAGARWLVNVTNDEWFGRSAALYQHAAMSVFRAVENHVPLARCANTGLTMLVDGNGRVTRSLPVFESGVLTGSLASPGVTTWYSRLGDWPGLLCGAWVAFLLLRALTLRRAAA